MKQTLNNDPVWDLRHQRRPTIWLVEPVGTDITPLGAPQVCLVQFSVSAVAEDSSHEESSVYQLAA